MLPVLAIVGRPNVGKSTLFNQLTAGRNALVADVPGLTRDRQYGYAEIGGKRTVLIDTGGLAGDDGLAEAAETQTWKAVAEASAVLLLVDARTGLTPADIELGQRLRAAGKPVWLLVNKAEGLDAAALGEFHSLGFANLYAISARRGTGIPALCKALAPALPEPDAATGTEETGLAVAVIGRPNVGKSTLINRLLGEDRLVASEVPGTTRDAIRIPLVRDGRRYVLVDTAGLRRRTQVTERVERLGVLAAVRALEQATVAIVMTDASEGVTSQDQRLIRLALERGRAVVVALNKWDGLAPEARHHARATAERRLAFAPFVRAVHLSALRGTGMGELMAAVTEAGAAADAHFGTASLNRVLETLVAENPPPLIRGRRIRLRYAHSTGTRPPRIVVHGSQAERLPAAYRRYLAAGFREAFRLTGVSLALEFKSPPNPYAKKSAGRRPQARRTRAARKGVKKKT